MIDRKYRIKSCMDSNGIEKYFIQFNDGDFEDEDEWYVVFKNGITPDVDYYDDVYGAKMKISTLIKIDNFVPSIIYMDDL